MKIKQFTTVPTDDEIIRFLKKVAKQKPFFQGDDENSPCWNWIGAVDTSTNGKKYGRFSFEKRAVPAHRFAFYIEHGIDPPYELDHKCKNTLCVNPRHLQPISHAENMRQTSPVKKRTCVNGHAYTEENTGRNSTTGRRFCKECARERDRKRYQAKYQRDKERDGRTEPVIMRDFARDPILDWDKVREIRSLHQQGSAIRVIARQFNVSPANIRSIVNYRTWKE